MQIKSEKYSYVVPGLEKFRLTTMNEVYDTIEELALVNEKYPDEEDIDRLYYTHKVNAKANEHFNSMLKFLNKLERKKPGGPYLQKQIERFIQLVIIRHYYAYIYKDFSKFGLTLTDISYLSSLHNEYLKVCKKIVLLYEANDFKSVAPADDPGFAKAKIKAQESKKYLEEASIQKSGFRHVYNAYSRMLQNSYFYEHYVKAPKNKPIHYMKIALDNPRKISSLYISGLKGIVIYHLQTQREAKNLHNRNYRKHAAKLRKKDPDVNVEKICQWRISNPGNNSKSNCAKSIGLNRTTVYRNWAAAEALLLHKTKIK